MRDFASCFSDHAIKVADSACSSSSSSTIVATTDSNQAAVSNLYRTQISTQKDLLIKVTWSKTPIGQIKQLFQIYASV